MPLLSLRYNKPNAVRSITEHTPLWTDQVLLLYGLKQRYFSKIPSISPHHRLHTHSLDASPFTEVQRTQSIRPQDTPPIWTDIRHKGLINEISRNFPLFSPHHRPHTLSRDVSPFTEVQRTQPSPFDRRTHLLYRRTIIYGLRAYLTKFLGNSHYFHRITAPTHFLGTPLLSLRYNEPNPVRSTT